MFVIKLIVVCLRIRSVFKVSSVYAIARNIFVNNVSMVSNVSVVNNAWYLKMRIQCEASSAKTKLFILLRLNMATE